MSKVKALRVWWTLCRTPLRLVVINAVVFVLLTLAVLAVRLLMPGYDMFEAASLRVLSWVTLPGSWAGLLAKPWTFVTYMFTQYDVWHLLMNMLWLYWFGGLLMMQCSGRQLTGLYLMSGFAGAVCYMTFGPLVGTATRLGLLGASASVMGVVAAVAVIMPRLRLRLMLVGEVEVVWIALITIILFALGLNGYNAAANIAHLGGVLMGVVYGLVLRRGIDLTAPLNGAIDKVVNFVRGLPAGRTHEPCVPTPRGRHTGRGASSPDRADIADILDKVRHSGYASLTPDERRRLFGG